MQTLKRQEIVQFVADYFGEVPEYFLSTKNHDDAYRRRICFYFIRKYTGLKHTQIGLALRVDDTTVKTGVKYITDGLANGVERIKRDVEAIESEINKTVSA